MPPPAGNFGSFYFSFFFLSLAWVSAEAATLFSSGVDLGLLRILAAFEAILGLVVSFFFDMAYPFGCLPS
jgi:hypothetical protein